MTVAALLLAALPLAAFEMKLCEECRRNWDDSPARIRLVIGAGNRDKTIHICSPLCCVQQMDARPNAEFKAIQVVDWRARGEVSPTMLMAQRAHFLVGIDGDEQKTREPYVAAFNSERLARAQIESLGGQLLDWDALLERCRKLAEDDDSQPARRSYQPLGRPASD